MPKKISVLMVCMGNICRSPTAHGVLRSLLREQGLHELVEVDSAGTHGYHVGDPPDLRSQSAARARGVELSDLRARAVHAEDFHRFDYVLAMDESNYQHLSALCPPERRDRLRLLLDFAPATPQREVPDPYYGGSHGFEHVLDLVEAAARGLLQQVRRDLEARD